MVFLLGLTCADSLSGAPQVRTDINPALRYYQAFLEKPDLAEPDHEYLFVREWRGQPVDKRFGELVSRFDSQFRLLREAARAEVPCDWGIDLSEGPEALLPGLARAKATAQATRLRVLWHLHHGRQAEARDDLLAAFTLARNVSRDGVLISALVQMAMENILGSIVAETFSQWQPQILEQIAEGLARAPARGTVAQCIAAEKLSFHDWMLRKVQATQREVWHWIIGTIDTREEFDARRALLAQDVWDSMRATDSRECRACHDVARMDFAEQDRYAARRHQNADERGETCIDCHQGVAHVVPPELAQAPQEEEM